MSRIIAPSTQAYRLIRDLLSEQPRTFQELLKAGIAAVPSSEASSSAAGAEGEPKNASSNGKGKGKAKALAQIPARGQEVRGSVPAGHPFVSANYLKHRILPVLTSQNLVLKSASSPSSTPSSSSKSSAFRFSLVPSQNQVSSQIASSSSSIAPTWDTANHWNRLLSSESPSAIAEEYRQFKLSRREYNQDLAFDNGKRRSERDIWNWKDRVQGRTTALERVHLNTRKQKGRTEKELRRLGLLSLSGLESAGQAEVSV